MEIVEKSMEIKSLGVTTYQENIIQNALFFIKRFEGDLIEIKPSKMTNYAGEMIKKVVLTINGNNERFVCFI